MTNRFGGFLGEDVDKSEMDEDSEYNDEYSQEYEEYHRSSHPQRPMLRPPRMARNPSSRPPSLPPRGDPRGRPHERTPPHISPPRPPVPPSVQSASLSSSRLGGTPAHAYHGRQYRDQSSEITKLQAKIQELEALRQAPREHLGHILPPSETDRSREISGGQDVWFNRVNERAAYDPRSHHPPPSEPSLETETKEVDVRFHTQDFSTVIKDYVFETITDDGTMWGQISSLYNTDEKIRYTTVPTHHHPIYLSGLTYATLQVNLSWFPIPGNRLVSISDWDKLPLQTHTFKVICYRDYSSGKIESSTYRCRIANGDAITKSKQEAAIQEGSLHFSARLFENTDNILNLDYSQPLFYLDLKVGYNPPSGDPSLETYRIYWRAHITGQFSQI